MIMRVSILLVFFLFLSSCGMRTSTEVIQAPTVTPETPSLTSEDESLKVERIIAKPLTNSQKNELDSTLPSKVRTILEKAETLEVLGLSSEDKTGIGWYPDIRVKLPLGDERKDLLNAFFFDASAGPNPSACFIPRHGLKATYKGKTVEVIICYQCHLFVVEGDVGEFDGGVYKEGAAAHHLFENLLRTRSEPIK